MIRHKDINTAVYRKTSLFNENLIAFNIFERKNQSNLLLTTVNIESIFTYAITIYSSLDVSSLSLLNF